MSYIDVNLGTGEKVEYRGKVHWGIGLPYFLIAGFLVLGGSETVPASFLFLVIGIIRLLIARITNEYGVTNRRVIVKTGFIARNTTELNLKKIESASVNQGVIGRILGYGSLTIRGSGGTAGNYKYLANPTEFRRALNNAIEAAESPTSDILASTG